MESPIVIEHRDALIYMLCEAAELEHAIACQYLFAGFSLKRTMEEGLDERQLRAVAKWHQIVSEVAVQEMMHLAQVNNLLISIGAAPRVGRPNLPQRGRHYPPQVQFALVPFSERALRHFLFLERPEAINREDAEGFEALEEAEPVLSEEDIVPRPQDFSTVGHLYHSIEQGLERLTKRHGENWLFIGPRHAQATAKIFRWPELVAVHDLATAKQGINMIVEQGEGPRGHWRDAHYGRFLEILGEYLTFKREDPSFEPARPVMACTVRKPVDTEVGTLVSDRLTAHVLDAFNVAYEVTLQALARFFGKGNETEPQHRGLADLAVELMIYVLKPLGELVTTMPVGPEFPGMTAGPSFELFFASGYLLPHHRSAFVLLHERLMELHAFLLRTAEIEGAPEDIAGVAASVEKLAASFAGHTDELPSRAVAPPPTWLGTKTQETSL
jgi:hypothetical protein